MKQINKIIQFESQDLTWSFGDANPKFYYEITKNEYFMEYVEPFPCYSHNINLVNEEVERIQKIFPIKFDTYFFLLPNDTKNQTNGWAEKKNCYSRDKEKINEQYPFIGSITLAGKRIPLMPAMTKYLVSHEYSHIIDYYIQYKMGIKEETITSFDRDYAKLRGIECSSEYGGLKWHKNIGEIIANDIRICLFNAETDFWPHDCEYPLNNSKIIDFWKEMKEKYENP